MASKLMPRHYGDRSKDGVILGEKDFRLCDTDGTFRRSAWTTFTVTSNSEPICQYGGIDVTLDDVIRRREVVLQRKWNEARNKGVSSSKFLEGRGNEVVWDKDEVEAVLVPMRPFELGHTITLRVYRFDTQCGAKDPGRIEGVPAEKAPAKPKRSRKKAPAMV